ncbi:MAG: DUF370 domain-containing protein [Negativicutes bacterium]|jgi:hypothetical protein|nr:DUF370 domain-containing protein [Negativicutes bacterium]MBP8629140.1 DUF370 domain-containing protein [Negativicutes bacterium]MBP9537311.1 DUF370 domain-containing protein [Negativicutes bacterium]MBP9949307.1 DUF370 domain-containing protein [Negativicutes bacterium]
MFLHLGSDVSVALKDVIAINDYSYLKTINKEFLKNMRSKKFIIDISENDPKSFVITDKKIYLSAISSVTLKKRADNLYND